MPTRFDRTAVLRRPPPPCFTWPWGLFLGVVGFLISTIGVAMVLEIADHLLDRDTRLGSLLCGSALEVLAILMIYAGLRLIRSAGKRR
jgi:hypothetical protein